MPGKVIDQYGDYQHHYTTRSDWQKRIPPPQLMNAGTSTYRNQRRCGARWVNRVG